MPHFNYLNAYVCKLATLPSPFSGVSTVAASLLQVLGIAKAESGYTLKASQKQKSSTNVEYSLSNILEVKIDILSILAPSSAFADLDNKQNCIVLVNSENLPELVPENVEGSYKTLADLLGDTPLPAGVTCTVLRPITTFIDEDIKLGNGQVAPFQISGSREIVGDKDECRLLNIPVGSPTEIITGVIIDAETGDPLEGVTLSWTDGTAKTTETDADGKYEIEVAYGFNEAVTPTKEGKTFAPTHRDYVTLHVASPNQNYVVAEVS
jgi:hypothetical protein